MRAISITGVIDSQTIVQHKVDRALFMESLPIGSQVEFRITPYDGETYLAFCNVVDVKIKYMNPASSSFKIELRSGDPLLYDDTTGLLVTSLARLSDGGYIFPYTLPVTWEDGGQATVVSNSGNSIIYPILTLSDAATDPVINNLTTGEQVKLNLTTIAGDEVVIDMANRTITLNGGNILTNRDDTVSSWWGLIPGSNQLTLDSSSSSDTVTSTVSWRNGVTGI